MKPKEARKRCSRRTAVFQCANNEILCPLQWIETKIIVLKKMLQLLSSYWWADIQQRLGKTLKMKVKQHQNTLCSKCNSFYWVREVILQQKAFWSRHVLRTLNFVLNSQKLDNLLNVSSGIQIITLKVKYCNVLQLHYKTSNKDTHFIISQNSRTAT